MSTITIIKWANSLGITEPVNGSWIEAIARHYGLYEGPKIIAIAKSLGINEPVNGSWVQAIAQHSGVTEGPWLYNMMNDGVLPSEPTPPTPAEPTPQGLYWESSVGTVNQSYFPAYGLYDYSTYGTIIKSSEIPSGVELFNKLQFQVGGYNSFYVYNNMTIKMYHITTDSFVGTTYPDLRNQSVSDETTIWSGNLSVTNGWNEIIFDTNFEYNGTDGIVILFENRDGSWQSGYGYGETHSVSSDISIYRYNDYVYYQGSQYKTNYRLNIKLGY